MNNAIICPHCHASFTLNKESSITAIRRAAQVDRMRQNRIESWRRQRRAFGLSLQGLTWAQVGKRINRNAKSAAKLATKYVRTRLPRREQIEGHNWIINGEGRWDVFSYRVSLGKR